MTQTVHLADRATRDDLQNFLQRLARLGEPEVRMQVRGSALAVYGCTQMPAGITDDAPLVLAMRAFEVTAAVDDTDAEDAAAAGLAASISVDTVVEVRALTDRLARLEGDDTELSLPDTTVSAAWAGVMPPLAGWEPVGAIDAGSLAVVAAEGMARVAAAVPTDAGDPVVKRVRREVWGSEVAPGIPAAAAFAAEGLGFLAGVDRLRVATSRAWTRLSGPNGHVLLRRSLLG